jgi:hypothetical protein
MPSGQDAANDPFETHKKSTGWGSLWNQPKKTQAQAGKGYKALEDNRPPPPSFLKLFTFPVIFFVITALSFTFLWEIVPLVPVIIACLMLGSVFDFSSLKQTAENEDEIPHLLPALSGPGAMKAIRVWLHIVVAWLAVFLGAVTGINADEIYMSQYYAIQYGREYTGVNATTRGAAYSDAGEVEFAPSSTVRVKKSVGFKDKLLYCAAPIMDTHHGLKSVSFWAVGYDCCNARGGFTCGDGASGRSGVRAPRDGIFHADEGIFRKAVNMSAAVHKLEVDEDVILLHWVKDAGEEAGSKAIA